MVVVVRRRRTVDGQRHGDTVVQAYRPGEVVEADLAQSFYVIDSGEADVYYDR